MCAHKQGETFYLNVNGFQKTVSYSAREMEEVFNHILDELTRLHADNAKKGERTVAFLAGPPGAGKSTLALALQEWAKRRRMGERVQCLGLDGFHKTARALKSEFAVRDGKQVCLADIKGAPETFSAEDFVKAVSAAKRGENVLWPAYDRTLHDVSDERIPVTGDILLIEGNWILLPGVWASAPRDRAYRLCANKTILRLRLIERKMQGGKTREEAEEWFEKVDGPNIDLFYACSGASDREIALTERGLSLKS